MRTIRLLQVILLIGFMLIFPVLSKAHEGPHGNDECLVSVGEVELRVNGYQFKGSNPDKHYCRHYPHLGRTIIKVDSTTTDLTGMAVEMELLKRNSWAGMLFNKEDAYTLVKQIPKQYFSEKVVSLDADIQDRDIYALKLRLYDVNGKLTEEQFRFFIGVPFAQVLVGIAVCLLIFITIIFLMQLKKA